MPVSVIRVMRTINLLKDSVVFAYIFCNLVVGEQGRMCSVKNTEELVAVCTSQLTDIRANMDF